MDAPDGPPPFPYGSWGAWDVANQNAPNRQTAPPVAADVLNRSTIGRLRWQRARRRRSVPSRPPQSGRQSRREAEGETRGKEEKESAGRKAASAAARKAKRAVPGPKKSAKPNPALKKFSAAIQKDAATARATSRTDDQYRIPQEDGGAGRRARAALHGGREQVACGGGRSGWHRRCRRAPAPGTRRIPATARRAVLKPMRRGGDDAAAPQSSVRPQRALPHGWQYQGAGLLRARRRPSRYRSLYLVRTGIAACGQRHLVGTVRRSHSFRAAISRTTQPCA